MTRIKGQLTTADYLPYKEFLRLLDALDRDREYLGETYCWLSFCTAFRASDVRTLKWKDVLGKKELVRIEQKTQKSRKVKFNAGVVEKTAGLYEKLGRPATESYIFANPHTGVPYSLEHINRQLKIYRVKYRIPVRAFSTHSFRKTFGRYVYELMGRSAESLILLNQIFRHTNLETTRRYIGLAQEDIDKVYMSIKYKINSLSIANSEGGLFFTNNSITDTIMSLFQIGKVLPDGNVRHIKAYLENTIDEISQKLRVFYSLDRRVDALLSLGDINVLGPSPFGKWVRSDTVHCRSFIRDGNGDRNIYSARIADNVETFAHMADHCLLYDNGIWYLLTNGECTRLEWFNFFPAHKDMRMFSVYVEGGRGLERINAPYSWSQLQKYADKVNWTLYVFRKEKLVKIIRPSNLKSKGHA